MLKEQKPLRLYVNGRGHWGAAHVLGWGRGAGSNVDLGETTVTEGRVVGGALGQSGWTMSCVFPGAVGFRRTPWETSWRQTGCGL